MGGRSGKRIKGRLGRERGWEPPPPLPRNKLQGDLAAEYRRRGLWLRGLMGGRSGKRIKRRVERERGWEPPPPLPRNKLQGNMTAEYRRRGLWPRGLMGGRSGKRIKGGLVSGPVGTIGLRPQRPHMVRTQVLSLLSSSLVSPAQRGWDPPPPVSSNKRKARWPPHSIPSTSCRRTATNSGLKANWVSVPMSRLMPTICSSNLAMCTSSMQALMAWSSS